MVTTLVINYNTHSKHLIYLSSTVLSFVAVQKSLMTKVQTGLKHPNLYCCCVHTVIRRISVHTVRCKVNHACYLDNKSVQSKKLVYVAPPCLHTGCFTPCMVVSVALTSVIEATKITTQGLNIYTEGDVFL